MLHKHLTASSPFDIDNPIPTAPTSSHVIPFHSPGRPIYAQRTHHSGTTGRKIVQTDQWIHPVLVTLEQLLDEGETGCSEE